MESLLDSQRTGEFSTDIDCSTSFRRAAISSAMAALSAGDSRSAARGNTKSSSMLMCCLYMEIRLAIAFRNASTPLDSKLPASRYRCPKFSTSACKDPAKQMVVFERLKPLNRGFYVRMMHLTQTRKQGLFLICSMLGRSLSESSATRTQVRRECLRSMGDR